MVKHLIEGRGVWEVAGCRMQDVESSSGGHKMWKGAPPRSVVVRVLRECHFWVGARCQRCGSGGVGTEMLRHEGSFWAGERGRTLPEGGKRREEEGV